MPPTRDEICTKGLEVLRQELGPHGFIVFMQQFENGRGNYAEERRAWVDSTSMDQLRELVKTKQSGKKKTKGKKPQA